MSIRVGGRGFARSLVDKIFNLTLTAPGRFDITGISPSYKRLEIFLLLRSDVAATGDGGDLFLNGDTTAANYRSASHLGGVSHSFGATDTATALSNVGDTGTAGYFSQHHLLICDYAGSKTKTVIILGGQRRDATNNWAMNHFVHWESTAAINQITVQPDGYAADLWVTGSQAIILGHR